jgi:hypothetical protein
MQLVVGSETVDLNRADGKLVCSCPCPMWQTRLRCDRLAKPADRNAISSPPVRHRTARPAGSNHWERGLPGLRFAFFRRQTGRLRQRLNMRPGEPSERRLQKRGIVAPAISSSGSAGYADSAAGGSLRRAPSCPFPRAWPPPQRRLFSIRTSMKSRCCTAPRFARQGSGVSSRNSAV